MDFLGFCTENAKSDVERLLSAHAEQHADIEAELETIALEFHAGNLFERSESRQHDGSRVWLGAWVTVFFDIQTELVADPVFEETLVRFPVVLRVRIPSRNRP